MSHRRSGSDALPEDSMASRMREKVRARREKFTALKTIGDTPRRDHNRPRRKLNIVEVPIDELKPARRRARQTSREQLDRLKAILARFDFAGGILANASNEIIAGHGLWEAARELGYDTVPCIRIDDLMPHEQEALAVALNRLGETGAWDVDALKLIVRDQIDLGEDVASLGFDPATIDILLQDDAADAEADPLPPLAKIPISRLGDIWICEDHRVGCGDARDEAFIVCVFGDEPIRLAFVDEPYNVPVRGHVTSKAHREFAMASGEMDRDTFRIFQKAWLTPLFKALVPGGYVLSCTDWRGVADHILCGEAIGFKLANVVVWNKPNPGQGSLWRSAHELIVVFRKSGGTSINNIRLGAAGRLRSNVWTYPGGASLKSDVRAAGGDHPTPKSLAMVADAILDVTHRGDLTADLFLGSGTCLLAAEKTGRRFRGLDIDPLYVDLAIRRWQEATGKAAILSSTGETFAAVTARLAREAGSDGDGEAVGPVPSESTASSGGAPALALPKPRRRVAAPSRREG